MESFPSIKTTSAVNHLLLKPPDRQKGGVRGRSIGISSGGTHGLGFPQDSAGPGKGKLGMTAQGLKEGLASTSSPWGQGVEGEAW